MVMRQPARVVCAPAASRSATAIGSSTPTSARVSSRTGRSRSVAGVPISSARYRTGPTSASARWPLGVNFGFLDLQAGNCPGLALAYCHDIGAIAAFLVSDRHCTNGASKPRRFLDGCVNLGDATIEVGDDLTLDGEAGLGVGGSVRERQIDGRHMIEVGAREKAEHADFVQAHQHADHRDQVRRRSNSAECQFSASHAAATSFPASSVVPMVITGQNAPAKIAVRPSMEKAADTQASASTTMNAARLRDEPRVTVALGISVTVGVTGVVTMISSALRRM